MWGVNVTLGVPGVTGLTGLRDFKSTGRMSKSLGKKFGTRMEI